jgi:hypothetical protein
MKGIVRIKDVSYLLPDELSSSIINEKTQTLFKLEHELPVEGSNLYLLGAVELSANGPGRMGYVAYNRSEGKWYFFEEWGTPTLRDLDSDGQDEFIVEFPGLHMAFENIVFFSYQQEVGLISAMAVAPELPNSKFLFAKLDEVTDTPTINIGSVEEGSTGYHYRYEVKQLVKIKHQ